MICTKVLEDAGVFGDILMFLHFQKKKNFFYKIPWLRKLFFFIHITIGEYHLDLIPFEDDLLSLELDNTFKELYLVILFKIKIYNWISQLMYLYLVIYFNIIYIYIYTFMLRMEITLPYIMQQELWWSCKLYLVCFLE